MSRTRPSASSPHASMSLPPHTPYIPSEPLLPTYAESRPVHSDTLSKPQFRWYRFKSLVTRPRSKRSKGIAGVVFILLLLGMWNSVALGTMRRDLVYVLRPLWDSPPKAFTIIPHFDAPTSDGLPDVPAWCGLHGWTPRASRPSPPLLVDAVLLSSEIDMLEIRLREYISLVDIFVVVESDLTFSGTPKPLHFALHQPTFERLVSSERDKRGGGSSYPKIVYSAVNTLSPDLEKGSFANEYKMRQHVTGVLQSLNLAPGALILNSDVDEIVSRDTIQLVKACQTPGALHLNVRNYRYGWAWPIPDGGYWRPHLATVGNGNVVYGHGRVADVMLDSAGWHCTFCFKTIREMREKMVGYSHNDRVRDLRIATMERIRRKVCEGREIFEMWPEAFTFKDLVGQSDPLTQSSDFTNVPVALRDDPKRFRYLLDKGCERDDE